MNTISLHPSPMKLQLHTALCALVLLGASIHAGEPTNTFPRKIEARNMDLNRFIPFDGNPVAL